MKNFTIVENQLVTMSRETVKFQFPIKELIEIDDIAVVCLKVPADTVFNENVFGVTQEGNICWQISGRKYVYENSPYMSISNLKGKIIARNWDCLDMIIEPRTGTIIGKIQSK